MKLFRCPRSCILGAFLWSAVLISIASSRDTKAVKLGPIPEGDPDRAVHVVPWSTLPGDIQQMTYAEDSLYFATRGGEVWRYDEFGVRDESPFLDLTAAIPDRFKNRNSNGLTVSAGLRGIAFHPNFLEPGQAGFGKFYTQHTEDFGSRTANHELNPDWMIDSTRLDSVVTEWTLDPATQRIDISSPRDVYRVQFPFGRHPGQQIAFNPAALPGDADYGNLYLSYGDAGSQDSDNLVNFNRVQGTDTPLGTIVRINPLQQGDHAFSIPADNPFVSENDGALDEIYAYGFRHPQTIAFDPATGRLFAGDMGQSNVEEVNLVEAGKNYGYGTREGTYLFTDQVQGSTAVDSSLREVLLSEPQSLQIRTDEDPEGFVTEIASRRDDPFTYPVLQFDHQSHNVPRDSAAVVAGSVYRGKRARELEGLYLFGNLSTDDIFYAEAASLVNDENPSTAYHLPLLNSSGEPTTLGQIVGQRAGGRVNMRFGQDHYGDIYIISKHNDVIYRLEGTPVPEPTGICLLLLAILFVTGSLRLHMRPHRRTALDGQFRC